MKKFRKLDMKDRETSTLQDNVASVLDILTATPILDGQIIETVLETGLNVVEHRLGRNYIGWICVDSELENAVFFGLADQKKRDKYIYVQSGSNIPTKTKIWVF